MLLLKGGLDGGGNTGVTTSTEKACISLDLGNERGENGCLLCLQTSSHSDGVEAGLGQGLLELASDLGDVHIRIVGDVKRRQRGQFLQKKCVW